MFFSSFEQMQKAVDIVNTSAHPENKIAATLFGTDQNSAPYSLSATNFWPPEIAEKIGTATRIGGSSGTIHAETACILRAPYTDGASLCVTDPFCPNCAKNIAEAGIRTIYVDHKGFDKDFASRRGAAFENMSMQICERAGISVYEIRRKEQKLTPILEIPESFHPPEEQPVTGQKIDRNDTDCFFDIIGVVTADMATEKFAVALARDREGALYYLAATARPPPGYALERDAELINLSHGKYSFLIEPFNRLLMSAARQGLRLITDRAYSNQIPTARELINLTGAGISHLYIDDLDSARDQDSRDALALLETRGVLRVN